MYKQLILPLLALAGVIFATFSVVTGSKPIPPAEPVAQPAQASFETYIAGAGIIESASENIAIGTVVAGVVTEVYGEIGATVKAGDPLFKLDDRDLLAQLAQKKAALRSSEERLKRLQSQPRAEDVPPAEARVVEAEANLADVQNQLKLYESVSDKRAVTEDELSRRRFAVQVAQAKLKGVASDLTRIQAGAWAPDLSVADAEISAARADIDAIQIELDRRIVRAPIAGQILQVKVRPGEYAQTGVLATPLMMIGNVTMLHVRVDVDENDAWRVQPERAARASVRGNRDLSCDLKFVRIEPFVVPKRSLTGDSAERVDTRVLQVLYSFPREALPVYVGQQMDVFIDAPSAAGDSRATSAK